MHNIINLSCLKSQKITFYGCNSSLILLHTITKVLNVIDCQEDKDLVFLVLTFGRRSLLNILCAGVLPSVSPAYKMAKQCQPIISSVKTSVSDCFDANEVGKGFASLKIDETFVTPVLAYNQPKRQAYCTCYQHGREAILELARFQNCVDIQQSIDDGSLHIPKECSVACVASVNENKPL